MGFGPIHGWIPYYDLVGRSKGFNMISESRLGRVTESGDIESIPPKGVFSKEEFDQAWGVAE
jgi:hypothetical protein